METMTTMMFGAAYAAPHSWLLVACRDSLTACGLRHEACRSKIYFIAVTSSERGDRCKLASSAKAMRVGQAWVCVWKQEAGRWGKEVEGKFLLELPSKFISFIVPIFPKSIAKNLAST